MPYGILSPEMKRTIQPLIQGQSVIDLGAGDLSYSRTLKVLGATRVLAVDKVAMPEVHGIDTLCCDFSSPIEVMDVAFVSWPINHFCLGLNEVLDQYDTVIYLGCNIEGKACGSLELFHYLTKRNPCVHIFEKRNTLLIYSKAPRVQSLYAEEIAAFDGWAGGSIMSYQDALKYNQDFR